MSKRTLSESSTGSEGEAENAGMNSAPYFKKPRQDHSAYYPNQEYANPDSSKPSVLLSQIPNHERRESQASTASTTTSRSSMSETEEDYTEGQKLSTALESDSSSSDDNTFNNGNSVYADQSISSKNHGGSANANGYSSFAQKMMSKMGYQEGKGLGKKGQGIVEPVQASKQRGRRGLGLVIKGLTGEGPVSWEAEKEHIEIEEKVLWINECTLPSPSMKELRQWKREGPRKESIDDETEFCDDYILTSVLKCKSVFDDLEPAELRNARTRSNPFETIRGVFFLNRAAMKMANLDAVFDFMFSEPKSPDFTPMVNKNELLYFADVCAGPGGFSEYILWRKQWKAKGFGFTLKGPNDFKLEDFFAGPPESFETHYGVNGVDGDGNVFDENNLKEFKRHVLDNTDGLGVHFMMADGGFTVEGKENIQEILSKQLYLCQFMFALHVVRPGGHFVCKLFDIFTPFSVGLIYLMYRAFERVCIHKPNTSRPANSERYIICKWKRQDAKAIANYLYEINCSLNEIGFDKLGGVKSKIDINQIVPNEIIMQDSAFYNYVRNSNNLCGEWQIMGLAKIVAFARDPNLKELRQSEIRDQCLDYWKVPNQTRKAHMNETPDEKIMKLLKNDLSLLNSAATEINPENLKECFKSGVYDWKCIILGSRAHLKGASRNYDSKERAGFFLGMGRSKVYQYNRNIWERIGDDQHFELSRGTLLYGEIVNEMRGEAKSQRRVTTFHIIDAIFLGGEDLRETDLIQRNKMCKIFAKAMNKNSLPGHVTIRSKEIFGLQHLQDQILHQLHPRLLKSSNGRLRLTYDVNHGDLSIGNMNANSNTSYFCPTGVLCQRIVKDPWMISISRSTKNKYWYNAVNRNSVFECPQEAFIDFNSAFQKRLIWSWDEGVKLLHDHDIPPDQKKLQANHIVQFIEKRLIQ